jgi:hypothetical protein
MHGGSKDLSLSGLHRLNAGFEQFVLESLD